MKILIFTCLCQRATHCCNVVLHPLQMLLVLLAAHNEGKDVFLQLKTSHSVTVSLEEETRPPTLNCDTWSQTLTIDSGNSILLFQGSICLDLS